MSVNSINTLRFGEIEVDSDSIIKFPEGLVGFPELSEFVVLDREEESPFRTLQSLSDASFSLIILNPFLAREQYILEVEQKSMDSIGAVSEQDLEIYCTVKMDSEIENVTINLKSPIIINPATKLGIQPLRYNTEYQVDEKLHPK